ncbi:hypothetical protein O8W32_00620 [Methanomassiliicoccales archaeon LGM-DZ1]|nr:hypothetical protein O8W32_00620 [Methanomassiliicoccales archaeon LGM-DZ1]
MGSREKTCMEPLFTRNFVLCTLVSFCFTTVFFMLYTAMAGYSSDVLGVGSTVSGLVASIFIAGDLIARLAVGNRIRSFGPRRMSLICMSVGTGITLLYFVSDSVAAMCIVRFVRHGTYKGAMYISNDAADGDLAPIILKFTVDESMVTVKNGGTVIHNNDVVTFTNDSELQVTTVDGKSHEITYKGTWSNSSGMSSGASGSELGTSTTIYIVDTMYFDAGNGTMEVGVKNE